jgi:hypothetical protein
MPLRVSPAGFSLVEAVVAGAVLLLACVAVGALIGVSLKGERSLQRRSSLESALDEECERLSALVFFRSIALPAPGARPTPSSLVAEVFPHARTECNQVDSRYCPGDGTDGASFVTLTRGESIRLRRESRFVVRAGGQSRPLSNSDLRRWAAWADALPPSSCVVIAVEAQRGARVVARRLELVSVLPSIEPDREPLAAAEQGS